MSRSALFLIVLLVAGISSMLVLIFLIDGKNQNPSSSINPSNNEAQEESSHFFNIDDSGSSLFLDTTILEIQKDGDRVTAQTSTFTGTDTIKLKILLFDKKIYPAFFLILSPDEDALYGSNKKLHRLGNANDVYEKSKILEGRQVRALFAIRPPPEDKDVLECNRELLDNLKGSIIKKLNCIPFAIQVAAYVKDN